MLHPLCHVLFCLHRERRHHRSHRDGLMRSCCVTRSAIAMAGVRIALAHGPSPGCDFQYTINRNRVSFEVCAARLGEAGHEKVLACQLLSISGMDSCQHRTIAIPIYWDMVSRYSLEKRRRKAYWQCTYQK